MKHTGTLQVTTPTEREITPPERLVSTESWGGNWPETVNTLVLSEKDGKTKSPRPCVRGRNVAWCGATWTPTKRPPS